MFTRHFLTVYSNHTNNIINLLSKLQRYDLLKRALILLICSEDKHNPHTEIVRYSESGLLQLYGRPGLDNV